MPEPWGGQIVELKCPRCGGPRFLPEEERDPEAPECSGDVCGPCEKEGWPDA